MAQRLAVVPRIGYLVIGSLALPEPRALTDVFRQDLRDLGYVEGQNIVIEYRWARLVASAHSRCWPTSSIETGPPSVSPWGYRVVVPDMCCERSVSGDQRECPISAAMPPLDPLQMKCPRSTIVLQKCRA